ncbi:MAG TPA: cation-translocating P-type ATPase [Chloroflexia bacterium]|nr:cation-translocating P-type ATPase [Chloroflexia bacterium]
MASETTTKHISEVGYPVNDAGRSNVTQFVLEGMDCGDCALTVEKAVAALPGVQSASVNFGSARLSVVASPGSEADLQAAVEHKVSEAGYRATPVQKRGQTAASAFWRRERRVLTTAIGAASALLAFIFSLFGVSPLVVNSLFAITLVVSGLAFARAGLLALRTGRADMNVLMAVAAIGAAALGDWAEAATVVLLFAFGGTLQSYTLEKTRGAIRSLMDLSPNTALVRRTNTAGDAPRDIRLPVEEVLPGETVLVGPGERVPLDGEILSGATSIDQSAITGESVPVDAEPGSEVYAGTINGPGAFAMRTLRASDDTTLARIIHMVEEAQARRAPSQQFVDRFSAIYTPVVIAGAALIALLPPLLLAEPFAGWFYRALVLLVVACPCALVISTPVSIVAAIGAATRRGVLIKGGATLETLGMVRAIAFDKTGTLTEGRPQVVSVHAASGDPDALLKLAASVEARSEHPLARAVVHAARELRNGSHSPEARNTLSLPGLGAQAEVDGQTIYVGNVRLANERGISLNGATDTLQELQARGNTAVLVGSQEGVLGVIALADRPRPDAKAAIEKLRRAGIFRVTMLTGDNPRTAQAIAQQVGVDDFRAELLPAEKVAAVRQLVQQHGAVAMVGDGVNDAPALAAANVGIAMGVAGTDAALEVADIALMSDDLSRLSYAVLLSRETLRVIKTNIAVSLAAKAVALALASVGALPLWGAILADMGVSLLVTLNGMRLLGFGRRET